MSDKNATLKFLNEFYNKSKSGCKTLDISTDREVIDDLLANDFIFHTSEGYFISTLGQDYLANVSDLI